MSLIPDTKGKKDLEVILKAGTISGPNLYAG